MSEKKTSDSMKVDRVAVENFKRINRVEIRPNGSLMVIEGRNAQGKSSLLDAIAVAIGGKKLAPARPIRDGESRATVEVDVGSLLVRRVFQSNGRSTLEVVNSETGEELTSPQAVLDATIGQLGFDPLEFTRMRPADQAELVARLAGVNLVEHKRNRAALYDERRDTNRDAKKARAAYDECSVVVGAPDAEVNVSELIAERDALVKQQQERDQAKAELARLRDDYDDLHEEIKQLQLALEAKQKRLGELNEKGVSLKKRVDEMPDPSTHDLDEKLDKAADLNRRFEQKQRRERLRLEAEALEGEAKDLTARMKQMDEALSETLEQSDIPVSGIGFSEDGVTLDGVPFEQASQAEQIRASVALAIATNPKLRVMFVREGSLLDQDGMALLEGLAKENDCQVFVERVLRGEPVGIVIEDGMVQSDAREEEVA
jgi:DNA repair exonuclease SbcCD ATPase subunit